MILDYQVVQAGLDITQPVLHLGCHLVELLQEQPGIEIREPWQRGARDCHGLHQPVLLDVEAGHAHPPVPCVAGPGNPQCYLPSTKHVALALVRWR